MRRAGKSLSEIADYLSYDDTSEVSRAINERMKLNAQKLNDEERENILQMDLQRIDALMSYIWPDAEMGDPQAIGTILKLIDQKWKGAQITTMDSAAQKTQILVIGGQEKDYIEKLKELG